MTAPNSVEGRPEASEKADFILAEGCYEIPTGLLREVAMDSLRSIRFVLLCFRARFDTI